MRQHYTEEEANGILQRAVECQVGSGGMSRAQLEAIASEIGVTADALARAESEYLAQSEEQGLRRDFNTDRRHEFRDELLSYVAVNTFLVLMDHLSSPGVDWSIIVILAWGLGLVLSGIKLVQNGGEEYEADYRKWLEKREKKALQSRAPDSDRNHEPDFGPGPYPYARS